MSAERVNAASIAPKQEAFIQITVGGEELVRTTIHYWEVPEKNLQTFEEALRKVLDRAQREGCTTDEISHLRSEYLRTADQQSVYEMHLRITRNPEFTRLFDEQEDLYKVTQQRAIDRIAAWTNALNNRPTPVR